MRCPRCGHEHVEALDCEAGSAGVSGGPVDGGAALRRDTALGFVDPAAPRRGRRLGRLVWIVLLAQLFGARLTGCGPAPTDENTLATAEAVEASAAATPAAPAWVFDTPGLATAADGTLIVQAVGGSRANVAGAREPQAASVARGELVDPLATVLDGAARAALLAQRHSYRLEAAALDARLTALIRELLDELLPGAELMPASVLDDGRAAVRAQLPVSALAAPLGAALARWQAELAAAGQLGAPLDEVRAATAALLAELLAADRDTLQRRLEQARAAPWTEPAADDR